MLSRCSNCGKPSRRSLCSECRSGKEKSVYSSTMVMESHIKRRGR